METFSALLALCGGNSPVTGESPPLPHKGQWRGALIFSLIYAWINIWVNNREAGDFRHHGPHYDVIVMCAGYFKEKAKYFQRKIYLFLKIAMYFLRLQQMRRNK